METVLDPERQPIACHSFSDFPRTVVDVRIPLFAVSFALLLGKTIYSPINNAMRDCRHPVCDITREELARELQPKVLRQRG